MLRFSSAVQIPAAPQSETLSRHRWSNADNFHATKACLKCKVGKMYICTAEEMEGEKSVGFESESNCEFLKDSHP